VSKGEVDAALALHEERIQVFEELGDRRSRAVTLWDLSKIAEKKGDSEKTFQYTEESYKILYQSGDAGGLSIIGEKYGRMLCERGDKKNGLAVLHLSKAVYEKLGSPGNATAVANLIRQFS
jgi:predicted solute-binding protein